MFIVRGLLLKYMNRRSEFMSAVSMNEAAKKNLRLFTVSPYFAG